MIVFNWIPGKDASAGYHVYIYSVYLPHTKATGELQGNK